MPSQAVQWDFFIAHSGQDKQLAEELYQYLAGEFRVFLDSRALQYGDDWDIELPRAQQRSKVTVVLVSNHTEGSYYERVEIASAIAMARADPARHRLIPCFLERGASQREDIPYGLRLKHGISLEEAGSLKNVAEKLAQVGRQPSDARADASGILQLPARMAAATTAFIGLATRGPLERPMLLTSWAEYERVFGAHTDPQVSFLSYAVKGFFENGGQRAYVVRIAGVGAVRAGARIATRDREELLFQAVSAGAWGNSLRVCIEAGARRGLRITLYAERANRPAELLEDYDNLSLDSGSRNFFLAEINNESEYLRAEVTPGFEASTIPLNIEVQLCGGTDGPPPTAADYLGKPGTYPEQPTGLAALEAFNDVSIVCVPDHVHPSLRVTEQARITDALIDECERFGDRFAILGVPGAMPAFALPAPRDTAFGAAYYPWVRVSSGSGEPVLIPAVGHIAGAYAKSDLERGIQHSPAGREICGLLSSSQGSSGPLECEVAMDAMDRLKRMGINAITCNDNHVRMHTAITMSVDKASMDLAARRLLLFITKSIHSGTTWALFESNDEQLWTELRARVAEFLRGVWESGALGGQTPEEAFFVRCGRDTMTQEDIDNRRIVLLLGLSLLSSAEPSTLSFSINQAR
jgi:hypothetical protein